MEYKRKILLYIGIFLLLFNYLCSNSAIFKINETISTIILFVGMLLLLISSFLKKNEKYIKKIVFLLLAAIVYFVSKQSDILQLCIIMISLKNEKISIVIKFIYKIIFVFIAFHIIAYILVYIYDKTLLTFNSRFDTVLIRHKFLFNHANVFGLLLCWLNIIKIYFQKDKIKLITIMQTIINIIFIIVFPNSRTSAIVLFILLLTLITYKNLPRILKKMMKYSIVILFCIFLIFVRLYPTNTLVKKIDDSFSARIKLGYVALNRYGIKPFGQNIEFLSTTNEYWEYGLTSFTIDSVYYKYVFSYGYIITIVSIIYILKRIKKISEEDNICCFILAYATAASMESVAIFPLIAFVPLLLINNGDEKYGESVNNNTSL